MRRRYDQPARYTLGDDLIVGLIAALISILAYTYFYRHHEVLLYGDATAHINIARRVFDSLTPGLKQLGTVWLPLPHLLMVPFLLSNWMWTTGLGGSIPTMAGYIAGVVGIFRLVRGAPSVEGPTPARFAAAWCAALAYALNPNLIYLQATAMTEPLYLAFFVWAAVFCHEFVESTRASGEQPQLLRARALKRCGIMLACAMLTRYDGWFAALGFAIAALIVIWHRNVGRVPLSRSPLRPLFVRFVLVLAIAPVLWFAYNVWVWGNPFEFATGPYSAPAIEARADRPGGWHYPGWKSPGTAVNYYLKAAKMDAAAGASDRETEHRRFWRLENLWLPAALIGVLMLLVYAAEFWPWLMLWLPLPSYAVSIAWGGVPIFVPVWWPYSYYNLRYGLELLPAFVVSLAAIVYVVGTRWGAKALVAGVVLFAALVGLSYRTVWRSTPVLVREAYANNARRVGFERAVARQLDRLPPGSTLMVYTADHAAVLQFAGFPCAAPSTRPTSASGRRPWPRRAARPTTCWPSIRPTIPSGAPLSNTPRNCRRWKSSPPWESSKPSSTPAAKPHRFSGGAGIFPDLPDSLLAKIAQTLARHEQMVIVARCCRLNLGLRRTTCTVDIDF